MALVICQDVNPSKEENIEQIKHEIKLDNQTLNLHIENVGTLRTILFKLLKK